MASAASVMGRQTEMYRNQTGIPCTGHMIPETRGTKINYILVTQKYIITQGRKTHYPTRIMRQ